MAIKRPFLKLLSGLHHLTPVWRVVFVVLVITTYSNWCYPPNMRMSHTGIEALIIL